MKYMHFSTVNTQFLKAFNIFSLYFQLEEEISRLEMLLEIPAITYFRLTDELLSLMPEGEIDINVITASMRGGGLQR